jgi:hypothetical protein
MLIRLSHGGKAKGHGELARGLRQLTEFLEWQVRNIEAIVVLLRKLSALL